MSLLILVRAPHPAEPFDETFEFFVADRVAFAHVNGKNAPAVSGTTLFIDAIAFAAMLVRHFASASKFSAAATCAIPPRRQASHPRESDHTQRYSNRLPAI